MSQMNTVAACVYLRIDGLTDLHIYEFTDLQIY